MAPKGTKTKRSAESTKVKGLKAPKEMSPDADEIKVAVEEVDQIMPKSKKKNGSKMPQENGDSKGNGTQEEDSKIKPTKGKRGQKKGVETPAEVEKQEQEESSHKRRRKADEKEVNEELESIATSDKTSKKNVSKRNKKTNISDDAEDVIDKPEVAEPKPPKNKKTKASKENKQLNSIEISNVSEIEPKNKRRQNEKNTESVDVKEYGDLEKELPQPKKRKVTKKSKDDVKDTSKEDQVKPVKGKRGQKKVVETVEEDEEQEEASNKRQHEAEQKDDVKDTSNEDQVKPVKGKRGQKKVVETVEDDEEMEQEEASNKRQHEAEQKEKVEANPKPVTTSTAATEDTEDVDLEPEESTRNGSEEKESKKKGRKPQLKKAEPGDNKANGDVKKEPFKEKKVTKKDEMDKGDIKKELEETKPKPTKGKRGQKKVIENVVEDNKEEEEKDQEVEETTNKRRRKVEEKAPAEDKKKAPPKNKASTDYEGLDFSNTSKNGQGKEWNFKISSWNVDGIRAWMSKGGLDYIKHEKPDILCLQETKCSQDKLPSEITNLPGYHAYWLCSEKDGYAGVGIYTTKLAMNVQYGLQNEELDSEGRIITAEYEQFYLICTYVPNAGRKLVTLPKRLEWNKEFRRYVKELEMKKPVIICGDMNVAHDEIDLANPKTNKKNAGFTAEERAGMTELLGDGFVDTYRHFYPDKIGSYTFWTYMMNSRAKNVGWRLDYFLVSEKLLPMICDNAIRDKVYGSDHCPISLFLHLTSADKPKEQ